MEGAASPSLPPNAEGRITRQAALRAKASCNLEPLLSAAGLTVEQIQDPRGRIGVRSQIDFLNLVAEALRDELLGFHLVQDFEPREMGLLYYVQASSATFGNALTRLARYSSIIHQGLSITCHHDDSVRVLVNFVGVPRHIDRHQMEALTTLLIRISQQLTAAPLRPLRIRFAHPRCQSSSELEKAFGRAIEFGAEQDEITFAGAVWNLPVVSADPYLNECLVAYWEDALKRRGSNPKPLRAAIENAILPLLPHGKARIGDIASALGVTTRTLSRRLAAEGLTFGHVLDEMRADLGRRYMDDPNLSIGEIAWLLGFQEASAFTHAFKRWTGKTPSQWRRHREERALDRSGDLSGIA
jgi:AraC-like DNA-binding protein